MDNRIKNDNLVSIKNFVEQRKDLLSIVGVFAALTLFAQEFIPGTFGSVVSFLFLSSFVLLWLELWSSFPSQKGTTRLALFENTIIYTGGAIVIYWFARLNEYSSDLFIFAIALTISAPLVAFLSKKIKQRKIFNRLFRTQDGQREILRFIFAFIILFGILVLVIWIVDRIFSIFGTEIENLLNLILYK